VYLASKIHIYVHSGASAFRDWVSKLSEELSQNVVGKAISAVIGQVLLENTGYSTWSNSIVKKRRDWYSKYTLYSVSNRAITCR
jgi:hypothetical protein